jgi:hypothetical protein
MLPRPNKPTLRHAQKGILIQGKTSNWGFDYIIDLRNSQSKDNADTSERPTLVSSRMLVSKNAAPSSLQSRASKLPDELSSNNLNLSRSSIPRTRKSRNTQTDETHGFPSRKRLKGAQEFRCPICPWTQKTGKGLSRHVASHQREFQNSRSLGWWCKGVPVAERAKFPGLEGAVYEFDGQEYIGGCLANFARRDGLKRHLTNPNVPCIGEMPGSEWHFVRGVEP